MFRDKKISFSRWKKAGGIFENGKLEINLKLF